MGGGEGGDVRKYSVRVCQEAGGCASICGSRYALGGRPDRKVFHVEKCPTVNDERADSGGCVPSISITIG